MRGLQPLFSSSVLADPTSYSAEEQPSYPLSFALVKTVAVTGQMKLTLIRSRTARPRFVIATKDGRSRHDDLGD